MGTYYLYITYILLIFVGVGVVYVGLEEAAKALGRTLTSQAAASVSHK